MDRGYRCETSDALLNEYLADDALAETYIGWSVSTDYNEIGSYVRIDGPRLWLEFASQQGVGYIQVVTLLKHTFILFGVMNLLIMVGIY